MKFDTVPPADVKLFRPRHFYLTLVSQAEVDSLILLATEKWRWDEDGNIFKFLTMLGEKLKTYV